MSNRMRNRRKPLVVERVTFPVKQLAEMGSICCWDGCGATFKGAMPAGWEWHLSYHASRPTIAHWGTAEWIYGRYHDYALCPRHVRALNEQLKFKAFTEIAALDAAIHGPAKH